MTSFVDDRRRERIENTTDVTLAALCLLGALIALVSLFYESRDVGGRGEVEREAIGRLSVALTQVRRRPANSLVWRDVSTGAVVYDGDTMFVPPLAYARISFVDGSELVLDPESLSVIEKSRRQAGLDVAVERGTVSGRAASDGAVVLRSGRIEAQLSVGAEARVSRAGEAIAVEVVSGESEVSASGERVLLDPSKSLRVDGDRREIVVHPVVLLAPKSDRRIDSVAAREGLEFTWRGELSGGELRLSSDRRLRHAITRPAAPGHATIALGRPGRYFWRIVGPNGEEASTLGRFWVVPPEPAQLLAPKRDFVSIVGEAENLRFEWAPVNAAASYRLEIIDVTDRKLDVREDVLELASPVSVAWSSETEKHRAYLPSDALAPGKYRWRVVPLGTRRGRPSAYRSVRVREAQLLQAPETLDPYTVVE